MSVAPTPIMDRGREHTKNLFLHDHATKLLRQLNETRKKASLCDGIIAIKDVEIPVQKSVLSAASHHFRALFDYGDRMGTSVQEETQSSLSTVCLDSMGIEEHTFNNILDFIYTAEVELSTENIQDMLQASDQLLMGELKEMCCEFLDTCITTQNCIGIFDFTSQLSCSWSHHKVSNFFDEHFSEVSHCEEFLMLEVSRVVEFLSRKTIQVKGEDEVVDAILRWFQFDTENRRELVSELISKVLFAKQLSVDALDRIRTISEVGPSLYQTVMKLQDTQVDLPFMLRGFTRVVIACGGEESVHKQDGYTKTTNRVQCVKIGKSPQGNWIQLASMQMPRTGHGLVEVGGHLYVAGGRDENCHILNSCEKYDPFTNTWSFIAPMSHARVGFGLIAIENLIYALGGSNDITDPSTSVEVYNVFTDKWRPLPDMMMKRVWASHVAAGKKIYVLGGGIVEKFYESVEVFDTRSLTWYAVSPMRERRIDARAVAVGNDVYVFGGFRRLECPSSAHAGHNLKLCGTELYTEKNDYWMPIQSRYNSPGLCVKGEGSVLSGALYEGDEILVVGELNMNTEKHAIRSYNRHLNIWECVVKNTAPQQSSFPCCILSLPSQLLYQLLQSHGKLRSSDAFGSHGQSSSCDVSFVKS